MTNNILQNRGLKLKSTQGPHAEKKMFRRPQIKGKEQFTGEDLKATHLVKIDNISLFKQLYNQFWVKHSIKNPKFQHQFYFFSIFKVTRFSQELLAGRVFETPVLRDP